MRLRCARASLRSSGVTSERDRLRGGQSEEEAEGEGEGASEGSGEGICSTTNAESAERFIVVLASAREYVSLRGGGQGERKGRSCRKEGTAVRTWVLGGNGQAQPRATYLTRRRALN